MATVKIFLNHVVSRPTGKLLSVDIKDFYLGTPIDRPEYMRVHRSQIPVRTIQELHLEQFVTAEGYIMFEITKGIYGHPAAGRWAQQRLFKHLHDHGYEQDPNTPCLFKDTTSDLEFTLVVDDFLATYDHKADALRFTSVLRKLYEITEEWDDIKYLGFTVALDRTQPIHSLTLSMPGYTNRARARLGHTWNGKVCDNPVLPPPAIDYHSKKPQKPTADDNSPALSTEDTKWVQQVVGTFLYYARALDCTMLTAVNKIASRQACPTQQVKDACQRLLDYSATWPEVELVFQASDMILKAHSDASYLSETKSRSRAGGILYLTTTNGSMTNGAVQVFSGIIPTVVTAASEAEYAGCFLTGQECVALRHTLEFLGHPQPATVIVTDNEVGRALAHRACKQKRSKAIDMRYHWIRDQVALGNFTIKWEKGADNLADYFTKSHPTAHHRNMRATYVHTPNLPPNSPHPRANHARRGGGAVLRQLESQTHMLILL